MTVGFQIDPQYQKQIDIENKFSKKNIDALIQVELEADELVMSKYTDACLIVEQWINGEHDEEKQKRLEVLKQVNIPDLVMDLLIITARTTAPVPIASFIASVSLSQGFNEKLDGIKTMAEIIVLVCATDLYDINKRNTWKNWQVVSNLSLSLELRQHIAETSFLPPMVCKPSNIYTNFESPHLTENHNVILGSGNSHNMPISLDVINKQNQVRLRIDQNFIESCEEVPTYELDTPIKEHAWELHLAQSKAMYELVGNDVCYEPNGYDKRGRLYARGYHISTMGTAYKKACIEFADAEIIEVPDKYKI